MIFISLYNIPCFPENVHMYCLVLIFTTTMLGSWEDVIIPLVQLREMISREFE